MIIQRRAFLTGLLSAITAPAIVRIENIMPVRTPIITDPWVSFQSWPIGQPRPPTCVEGQDLLSRARQICGMLGSHDGVAYIRDRPLER